MPRVHLLSKETAELIAAGEVIERPCSIVKELVENSIDSGAGSITVEIKNGGTRYIRITDNGCGIEHDDVPTAFLRHATSKISSKEDLDSILTLGFRGEALASICAVSKVDVLTKTADEEFGTHYSIEGGTETEYERSGCPDGTTIVIRDIFYNVPARLKFLKKDVSEGNAIASTVDKIAVSHPEIAFKFIRDNKQEFITSGDGDLDRGRRRERHPRGREGHRQSRLYRQKGHEKDRHSQERRQDLRLRLPRLRRFGRNSIRGLAGGLGTHRKGHGVGRAHGQRVQSHLRRLKKREKVGKIKQNGQFLEITRNGEVFRRFFVKKNKIP